MDLKESELLGEGIDDHWYYRSKARAVERLLQGRRFSSVLDVGAGSGFFSKHLLQNTNAREAWCIDIYYENEADEMINGKTVHYRKSIGSTDADLALFMDVLEHIEDDTGLLAEYVAKVSRNCLFLISVPAFDFLWSEHDIFLGHKRRYRISEIESVVRRAGLSVVRGCYYFSSVFPIATCIRFAGRAFKPRKGPAKSQLQRHNYFTNETLALLSQLELPIMYYNKLFGLTAFCMAERK